MDARAGEASLADLLLLLEREPVLRSLNDHVQQKKLGVAGGLALIRCDGGGAFGYGHVKRMVALARALRDREGIGSVFTVNGTEDALVPIRSAGFEAELTGADTVALQQALTARKPDFLLLDCREGPSRAEVENLKKVRRPYRRDRRWIRPPPRRRSGLLSSGTAGGAS